ncbi:MAG: helix-turn-helix transcriptional regulator [Candidatus Woesearchaeota archaeon]
MKKWITGKTGSENNLRPILLAISIIVGFIMLITITLAYIAQEYAPLYECGCAYTLPIIIVLLACAGIVVGVLTYYFLAGRFSKEKREIKKNMKSAYNLMEPDERKIIESLVNAGGRSSQSELDKKTGMDRVKVFRMIGKMEQKGILHKERNGKGNIIRLDEDILNLFKP